MEKRKLSQEEALIVWKTVVEKHHMQKPPKAQAEEWLDAYLFLFPEPVNQEK